MPYAKIDVEFVYDHFTAVPEKDRPAAFALYTRLVLASAELLLDGRLAPLVVEAGAAEIGISRGRYGRAEVLRINTSLVNSGLVEMSKDGTWILTLWRDHHASREYVDNRRKLDAERKAQARGQLTINEDRAKSAADSVRMSAADRPGTRARDARTRAAAKDLRASNPSTSNEYAASPNGKEPNELAAAEALEAPRPSEIRAACSTWVADVRKVEPLALALTRAEFDETLEKLGQRCTTGHIGNPAGLLIQLLREAVAKRERQRTGPVTIATPAEQVIADAVAYAKGGHPLEVAVELTERKLARLGVPETEWEPLTANAMEAYTAAANEEPDLGLPEVAR